jgi:hypothetical protein
MRFSCNCGNGDLHSVVCAFNWNEYTMITGDGDVFYPDGPQDAAYFLVHHRAQYVTGVTPCWPED